jgi:hypothetical protein
MKIKFLLLSSLVTLCFGAQAQPWVMDSISMGAQAGPIGYATDVYYSLRNGVTDATQSNTNWHLAFEMLPPGPNGNVGIRANHTQQGVSIYSLNLSASASYMTLSVGDTMGKLSKPLYNIDTNLHWGALNQNRNLTNIVDYGWGQYNMTTHHVEGDSLYLVKIAPTGGPTMWYKLWIQHYHSTPADTIHYAIRIAHFDGSGDITKVIYRKPNYENKNFAYYDIISDAIRDREPDNATWDILFTRYHDLNAGGPGVIYPTMGILSNFGISVAAVKSVSADTCKYASFAYTKQSNKIGYDWKSFTPPSGPWTIDTTATYFVKTKDEAYYQIKFTRFDGASTGKTVFAKRRVAFATTVQQTANKVEAFAIVPNPAVNEASIMVDAKENGNAVIIVTDITGKIVEKNNITLNQGVNGYRINTGNYNAGTYFVTVANGNWTINGKLIVQH